MERFCPARALSLLLVLPVLALLGGRALAQLDLPAKGSPTRGTTRAKPVAGEREAGDARHLETPKGKGKGDLVPNLVCSLCYERNYTTPIDYEDEDGLQEAWCSTCAAKRLHHVPDQRRTSRSSAGVLELPRARRFPDPTGVPGVETDSTGSTGSTGSSTGAAGAASPGGDAPIQNSAVTFVLGEVAKVGRSDDPVALSAVESLLSFGAPGLAAARFALASPHGPTVLTGVRVLLRSEHSTDADLVVRALRGKLPTRVAGHAVHALVELDPVRATPEFLVELLDHRQSPVRAAAQEALAARLDAALVPLLAGALESERSDTRLRALELLGGIEGDVVLDLCLEHLGDRSAKVARTAALTLARLESARVEYELLAGAFEGRWVLRAGAYALLALVEREDVRFEPILDEDHVPALLGALASSDPFVAGTAAAALAGIGFRSGAPSPWLDRDVPERLVATVVGTTFFDDYASLEDAALRRLKLIAGASWGRDGLRWADWWLAERSSFRASRAVISLAPGDEDQITVRYRSGADDRTGAFVLLAPGRAQEANGERAGEVFFITREEAADLARVLEAEGVLGSERLPGVHGSQTHKGRDLELRVGERGKRFVFGLGTSAPWFDRVVEMATSMAERNHWQRYPHPELHADARKLLWDAQSASWLATTDPVERRRRTKHLVLARLGALPRGERTAGVAELVRLYEDPSIHEQRDYEPLAELLADEPLFTSRAKSLARLAGVAAPERADELIDLLVQGFDEDAVEALAEVVHAGGSERVRAAARDTRPLLRAVAATLLATDPEPESRALLLGLLDDPAPEVESAAVLACGRARVDEARTALLVRARLGDGALRLAALEAVGHLGGEGALEALISGLTQADETLRRAASEGLADLADPSTAPLFISLLRQGRGSGVFESARRGLLALGESAWDELVEALRSPTPGVAREAALLLSVQSRPEAASPLMSVLTDDPSDRQAAQELAILTCVDHSRSPDPAGEWWRWWDGVRHDDALAWLRAALEARGLPSPPAEDFDDGGTREAVAFLIDGMGRPEPHLVERCRRELERLAGRPIEAPPPFGAAGGDARAAWLATLEEALGATR